MQAGILLAPRATAANGLDFAQACGQMEKVVSVGTSADSGISEILRNDVLPSAVGHTITTLLRQDLGRKDARLLAGKSIARSAQTEQVSSDERRV